MTRSPWLYIAASSLLLFLSKVCIAQSGDASPTNSLPPLQIPSDNSGASYKSKILPRPIDVTAPFALNALAAKGVEFLPADRMTAQDRGLVENADASIREAAALAGFELNLGAWSQEQIVCSALPEHVFVLYRNDHGAGDVSMFSAAVSRSGKVRARVIPIQRRGFSLYSPAPMNPLVVAEFNRIRAAESATNSADWLATALCYAALTGEHPTTAIPHDRVSGAGLALSFPPTLEVGAEGDATVRFIDVAAAPTPMQWALTFNSKGQLTHVTDLATPNYAVTSIPGSPDQQPPSAKSH